jgi:hypothetical protein
MVMGKKLCLREVFMKGILYMGKSKDLVCIFGRMGLIIRGSGRIISRRGLDCFTGRTREYISATSKPARCTK